MPPPRSSSTAPMPSASAPEGAGVRTIIEMVNLDAARLRHRLGRPVTHCAQPGAEPHPQPLGLPAQARRPAVRCAPPWPTWRSSSKPRWRWCSACAAPPSAPHDDPREAAYVRLLTPAVKFLVCKSTPQLVYESLECLGGNGYTEDLPLARYFRESPLNAIWEGSGNVMALDVLRAAGRHPDARDGDACRAHARPRPQPSTVGRWPRRWPRCCSRATPNGAHASVRGPGQDRGLAALAEAKSDPSDTPFGRALVRRPRGRHGVRRAARSARSSASALDSRRAAGRNRATHGPRARADVIARCRRREAARRSDGPVVCPSWPRRTCSKIAA